MFSRYAIMALLSVLGGVTLILSLVVLAGLAWDRSGRVVYGRRSPMALGDDCLHTSG
jgi:hypothetical protein